MASKRAKTSCLVHERIAAQLAEKSAGANIRKMAAALCATLQIPDGSALVLHLTPDPRIKTNLEAVACWISDQLEDPNLALSIAVLPTLVDMLSSKLRRIREDAPCW